MLFRRWTKAFSIPPTAWKRLGAKTDDFAPLEQLFPATLVVADVTRGLPA